MNTVIPNLHLILPFWCLLSIALALIVAPAIAWGSK
jgi:hypothetical protein